MNLHLESHPNYLYVRCTQPLEGAVAKDLVELLNDWVLRSAPLYAGVLDLGKEIEVGATFLAAFHSSAGSWKAASKTLYLLNCPESSAWVLKQLKIDATICVVGSLAEIKEALSKRPTSTATTLSGLLQIFQHASLQGFQSALQTIPTAHPPLPAGQDIRSPLDAVSLVPFRGPHLSGTLLVGPVTNKLVPEQLSTAELSLLTHHISRALENALRLKRIDVEMGIAATISGVEQTVHFAGGTAVTFPFSSESILVYVMVSLEPPKPVVAKAA